MLLDSKSGKFTIGSLSGAASFAVGTFHKVSVTLTSHSVSATLDGKVLGKSTKGISDGLG